MVKAVNGAVQSFAWAVNFGILSNWFPRKGRGILIGFWATNPNVGDIFGQRLYLLFTSDGKEANWGYTFITLAAVIEVVALVNLLCLVEYPMQKGIDIRERANIINPTVVTEEDSNHNDSAVEGPASGHKETSQAGADRKVEVEDSE